MCFDAADGGDVLEACVELLSLEDFVCYVIKRIQTNDNFEYFTGFF